MIQWFNKKLKNRKGFTLIELIVVIAILGILALIAIPRFAGIRGRAEAQAIETTINTIVNAAEVAIIEDEITVSTGVGTDGDIGGLVAGGYLRAADYREYNITNITDDGRVTVTHTPSGTTGGSDDGGEG